MGRGLVENRLTENHAGLQLLELGRSQHGSPGDCRHAGRGGLLEVEQLLLPQHGPVLLLLANHLLVERVGGQLLGGESAKVHLEVLGPVLEDLTGHGRIWLLLTGPHSSCCGGRTQNGEVKEGVNAAVKAQPLG